jgi:hypothetical protein
MLEPWITINGECADQEHRKTGFSFFLLHELKLDTLRRSRAVVEIKRVYRTQLSHQTDKAGDFHLGVSSVP